MVHSLKALIWLGALGGLLCAPAPAKDPNYIGAGKCKKCHNKEKYGSQYDHWKKSGHARAWETLGTDSARAVAHRLGLKGDPQKLKQCLECHVTAFGVPPSRLDTSFDVRAGVQCEACHGPGSLYKKKKVMRDSALCAASGMIWPDSAACAACHNEKSPSFKGFHFLEAMKEIDHSVPDSVKHGHGPQAPGRGEEKEEE